jgi:hypothetical protein
VLEQYLERLRHESLTERAQALDAMVRDGFRMGLIGLRLRHPNASEAELRVRLFAETYGRELAKRVYGSLPDDIQ